MRVRASGLAMLAPGVLGVNRGITGFWGGGFHHPPPAHGRSAVAFWRRPDLQCQVETWGDRGNRGVRSSMGTSRRRRTSSAKSSREARRTARGVQPKGAPAGERREVHQALAGQSDATTAALSAPRSDFPVVAVGASAGGLEAFKRFMGAMPADGGVPFPLISHPDPNHSNPLVELPPKK